MIKPLSHSLQNNIWNLLDQSTILPKYIYMTKTIYDKEGKLAGPIQILPVRVRDPELILKTEATNQSIKPSNAIISSFAEAEF